jgi:hypothetical protein
MVAKYLPTLGFGAETPGGATWIIWARGRFKPVSIPPGGHFTLRQRRGYVVVDDRSGRFIAYGFN